MTDRPVKQEQLDASDEITEVAPGILRLQLPIALPGLGHVNCYALEDDRGVAVVDPGLPGRAATEALDGRLAAAGFPVRRVHTVVVTHSHPDHYGGAGHLAKEAGADIVSHKQFRNWWNPADDAELDEADKDPEQEAVIEGLRQGVTPWGGESSANEARRHARAANRELAEWDEFAAPRPTVRLADAEVVRLAGRDWVAVHTPGHTPDHLCLFDPEEGVLLAGDHVLPTITPHISGVAAGPDPLARFFDSLERMHALDGVRHVLPAHGHPFTDLDGRVDAIRVHHEHRLDRLAEISARLGPATVEELSHELFQPRSWGPMAESETYAHLEHLRLSGRATRTEEGGHLRYLVAG